MLETGHCIMAFVASDGAGYPVEVPTWQPIKTQDLTLEKYAIQAKESAQSLDKELLGVLSVE